MKKLMVIALVMVVCTVVVSVEAVPTVPPIPPIPEPTEPPPETPEPSGGGGAPFIEQQQKFQVISSEPVMEGYAGGSIKFNLKVIQKGYPDLVVHLTAETPENWKVTFSDNDFDLAPEESVELDLLLSPPDTISAEQHEVKIRAVGKVKEDSLEVKDSVTVTAMTYLVDVGVTNLQFSPPQPQSGENVTISVVAVNYTQRITSDVVVEFLVNNGLSSRQTITLTAGASQPITFGWTAQPGTFTFLVRAQTAGDNNRRNDSVTQRFTLGGGATEIEALYQQAIAYYAQENYIQAQNLFGTVAAQYTDVGEFGKAAEASQYEELCGSYIQAETLMTQGEQAFQSGENEQAVQYFEQAKNIYSQIGDTEKQALAQQRLDEVRAQEPFLNKYMMAGIIGVAAVILAAFLISRRRGRPQAPSRYQAEPSASRFRLEEPTSQPPVSARKPAVTPSRATPPSRTPPAELVQFHEKTEDALSRFSKGYIRSNLQQAMRVYLSLEGEKKQLPKGKDLELERIIDTNLKELEHRIFGTF
ncbi:MAG: hypothetical protein AYK18_09525 [Theionarchaea archaeon DG-70]|nr:MAG: hypothetical protein AYK18_09525 [Theionarchaea archaeon DG-70]